MPSQVLFRVGALLFGAFASLAHAVTVSPTGAGQVLIYPYFNAQNVTKNGANGDYNTLVSLVNPTDDAKAVKLRVFEAHAGLEVLGFNIFLAPRDTWVAAIVPTAAGAQIVVPDKTCTLPLKSDWQAVPDGYAVDFMNGAYLGDGGGNGLERTREGMVHVIEMGRVIGAAEIAAIRGASNCGLMTSFVPTPANFAPPTGGLQGNAQLINVAVGELFTYEALALDNYSTQAQYSGSGGLVPTLATGDVTSATGILSGLPVTATFASGLDAVSAALMHYSVTNEFQLDAGTASASEWVFAFPTRAYHFAGGPTAPFIGSLYNARACQPFAASLLDRDGQAPLPSSWGFSPSPTTVNPELCYAVTTMRFARAGDPAVPGMLGSQVATTLTTTLQSGYLSATFVHPGMKLTAVGSTPVFLGLPVIGFGLYDYVNGVLAGGLRSNFGGKSSHAYRKRVQ